MSGRKKKQQKRTDRRNPRRSSSQSSPRARAKQTPAPSRKPRRPASSTDRTAQVQASRVQVTGPVASHMYGVPREWLRRNPDLAKARRKVNNKLILYRLDVLDAYFRGFDAA
jgi:hypothetical protein